MKAIKILISMAMAIILVDKIYAQDIERRGGIRISIGPSSTETVKALAQFIIKDSAGRQSGFDVAKGMFLKEIPNADCANEGIGDLETGASAPEIWVCYLFTPEDGIYKISIIGTASGQYSSDIIGYDINENMTFKELDGATYPGKIDNYEITYSLAAGSQVQVTYVGSSEIPVFDGKGQRATDVNKFLQYFNPTQTRTELSAGTNTFNLSIIYGNTITRETFSAILNGQDITSQFDPLPGKMEVVKIPLNQGSNTLVLSVKGARTDGRTGEDTDRLVFMAP